MRCIKRLNPLSWHRKTIIVVFTIFFATALPTYIAYGLTSLPLDFTNTAEVSIEGNKIPVPDNKIGELRIDENLTFLVGHNYGVFRTLHELSEGSEIPFKDKVYIVTKIETLPIGEISMKTVLTPDPKKKELRIMTCAGPFDKKIDTYTHRLIVYAEEVS